MLHTTLIVKYKVRSTRGAPYLMLSIILSHDYSSSPTTFPNYLNIPLESLYLVETDREYLTQAFGSLDSSSPSSRMTINPPPVTSYFKNPQPPTAASFTTYTTGIRLREICEGERYWQCSQPLLFHACIKGLPKTGNVNWKEH